MCIYKKQTSTSSSDPLPTLRRTLLRYDPADLLATVGALQLMPENSDRAVRFEVISHVVASIPQGPNQSCIKPYRLKSLFNSGLLASSEIVKDEDPHEFAFTESFAFFNGPYTVFPGVADDATFILRHLLKAIFRHRQPLD